MVPAYDKAFLLQNPSTGNGQIPGVLQFHSELAWFTPNIVSRFRYWRRELMASMRTAVRTAKLGAHAREKGTTSVRFHNLFDPGLQSTHRKPQSVVYFARLSKT